MALSLLRSFDAPQIGLLVAAFVFASWILRPTPRPYRDFPQVTRPILPWPWARSLEQTILDGYCQISKPLGKPFAVRYWAQDYLMMPPKYLQDLRAAPQSISFFQNLSDSFGLHASVGDLYEHPSRMIAAIKNGVNSRLTQLTPRMSEEADGAIKAEVGDISDWTEFNATQVVFAVSHRISCRFLVTKNLSQQDEFVQKTTKFVQSIFVTALLTKLLPWGPLRGPLLWPLSYMHRKNLDAAVRMVQPEVEARIAERSEKPVQPDDPEADGLDWILSQPAERPGDDEPRHLAVELLHNLWAGAGTPGSVATQMLYRVLMEPEYLEPLRDEAFRAVSAHGWTERAVQNLPLQDSFMRESNRVRPMFSANTARTVQKEPWTLHDGLTLPVGTRVFWPIKAIQTDPENFDRPLEFDGFRFARLDEGSGQAGSSVNKNAASYSSATNLIFGYGNHACPGRFYASRKVKIIFSKLLLDYDIRWAAPQKEYPPDVAIEGQFAPNLSVKICLKPRHSGLNV